MYLPGSKSVTIFFARHNNETDFVPPRFKVGHNDFVLQDTMRSILYLPGTKSVTIEPCSPEADTVFLGEC